MSTVELKELLELRPEKLAQLQHDKLREHGINILSEIITLMRANNYEQIKTMLFYSPAGDDMGMDSNCINMAVDADRDPALDMGDLVNRLIALRDIAKEKKRG